MHKNEIFPQPKPSPELLNQLGILIHAGAPELPVEQVMSMFLNGTIVYGDPSCHHHCEGPHHE